MSHERIAVTFDEWARSGRAEGFQREHANIVEQVIPRMGIRPGMLILELGCGTGWATRKLASAAPGARAIGIDLSAAMIARAEETHDLTSRARYEVGRFETLEFPSARFDRVFSMEAIYYAVDLDAALREMHRVLKPGGQAHVVLDCYVEAPTTETWAARIGLELHRLSEQAWRERLAQVGFAAVESERVLDSRGTPEIDPNTPHAADREARRAAGSLWLKSQRA